MARHHHAVAIPTLGACFVCGTALASDPGRLGEWLFIPYMLAAGSFTALSLLGMCLGALFNWYRARDVATGHAIAATLIYSVGAVLSFFAFRTATGIVLSWLVHGALIALHIYFPLKIHAHQKPCDQLFKNMV